MDPLRIAVVDDSALFRTLLRNVLADVPSCEVIASIGDGKTAIEKISQIKPDLVTLDIELPDLSGIDVLRELKRRRIKTKIIVVSRYTTAGAQVTTDALIEGAFDFILKPSGSSPAENKAALLAALDEKISNLRETPATASDVPSETPPASLRPIADLEGIVIGCSTGGPDALARIIPELPASLPVPVFVVQHMPEGFTRSLASRLNEASELEVLEAADGLRVRAGQVVLARGGLHLELERRTANSVIVRLTDAPHEHRCRPAVDYTLRSAVELFGEKLLAVILTGMGRDGTAGCQLVRSRGGLVLAQHATGCTVFGMPNSVIKAGLANDVVQLSRMAAAIETLTRKSA